jgi:hypothetical protein
MKWLVLVALVVLAAAAVVILAAGCGSNESRGAQQQSAESTTATAETTTASSSTSTPAIVGRWKRVLKCPEVVMAVDDAGLGAIAPSVVAEYFPGISTKQIAQRDHPCEGAKPFVHYHFFNDAGAFGSLDQNEKFVGGTSYEIIDEGRFRIGNTDSGVVFRYQVEGDALSLSPVLSPGMKKQALAHPLTCSRACLAIAVSYPGHQWKRVECGDWC